MNMLVNAAAQTSLINTKTIIYEAAGQQKQPFSYVKAVPAFRTFYKPVLTG